MPRLILRHLPGRRRVRADRVRLKPILLSHIWAAEARIKQAEKRCAESDEFLIAAEGWNISQNWKYSGTEQ